MIGLIIFSGVSVGFGLFFLNFANQYDVADTTTFNSSLQNLNKINNASEEMQTTFNRISSSTDIINTIFNTAALTIGVVQQFIALPGLFIGLIFDLNATLNVFGLQIPSWFIAMMSAIITVVIGYIAFAIFSNRSQSEV